jgi:hypothetical protein
VLLDDPELQETQETVKNRGESAYHKAHASGCDIVDLTELNTHTGCSGDSFMLFVEEAVKAKHHTHTDPLRAHLLKRQTATNKFEEGKRTTAGLHVCVEGHHVGQFALDIINKTREKKEKEASDKVNKKLKEIQDLNRKVVAALDKGGLPEHWTAINLKHMVQWYKIYVDPALPNNRQGLLDQFEKTKHCSVIDVNPDVIDNTNEDKSNNIKVNPIPSPTPKSNCINQQ